MILIKKNKKILIKKKKKYREEVGIIRPTNNILNHAKI